MTTWPEGSDELRHVTLGKQAAKHLVGGPLHRGHRGDAEALVDLGAARVVDARDDVLDAERLARDSRGSRSGPAPARTVTEDVELQLDLTPTGTGTFDLTLVALDFVSRALRSRATLRNVSATTIQGGIALVSSTLGGATGARHWLRSVQTGGAKIGQQPARALGPIIGTLYTVNGSVLKLTAQFAPVGSAEPQQVVLQSQAPGTTAWTTAATATLGPGYTAVFRVDTWDSTRALELPRRLRPRDVAARRRTPGRSWPTPPRSRPWWWAC